MADLKRLVGKAKNSGFYRYLLNLALSRMVPFNRPHGFRVAALDENSIRVLLPYRKKNFNHIRGIHACALATASEFATGLLLLLQLDASKYRLIMQRLEMDYHYQGKMDAYADFSITPDWMNHHIYDVLQHQDSVVVVCEIKISDAKGNHLTTGRVHWQIKDWKQVKTKVA